MESETMIAIDLFIITMSMYTVMLVEWMRSYQRDDKPDCEKVINDLKKSRNGKYPRRLKTREPSKCLTIF